MSAAQICWFSATHSCQGKSSVWIWASSFLIVEINSEIRYEFIFCLLNSINSISYAKFLFFSSSISPANFWFSFFSVSRNVLKLPILSSRISISSYSLLLSFTRSKFCSFCFSSFYRLVLKLIRIYFCHSSSFLCSCSFPVTVVFRLFCKVLANSSRFSLAITSLSSTEAKVSLLLLSSLALPRARSFGVSGDFDVSLSSWRVCNFLLIKSTCMIPQLKSWTLAVFDDFVFDLSFFSTVLEDSFLSGFIGLIYGGELDLWKLSLRILLDYSSF